MKTTGQASSATSAKTAVVPAVKAPVLLDHRQMKLVAGGLPKGGWAARTTEDPLPKGGW